MRYNLPRAWGKDRGRRLEGLLNYLHHAKGHSDLFGCGGIKSAFPVVLNPFCKHRWSPQFCDHSRRPASYHVSEDILVTYEKLCRIARLCVRIKQVANFTPR